MVNLDYVVICISSYKYIVTRLEIVGNLKRYIAVSDNILYVTDAEILAQQLNDHLCDEPLNKSIQCCIKEVKC